MSVNICVLTSVCFCEENPGFTHYSVWGKVAILDLNCKKRSCDKGWYGTNNHQAFAIAEETSFPSG